MWLRCIAVNFLPSFIKGGIAAVLGGGAIAAAPHFIPGCSTWLCDTIGGLVGLTVWGSSHGIGVPDDPTVAAQKKK